MNLCFQIETFETWLKDSKWLWELHFNELALDKDLVQIALDEERYRSAESLEQLHIATVRVEGKMVGYFIAAIVKHLHYKDAGLMAQTDMYFVHPEFRVGGCGMKLLLFVEQTLKARGVVKAYLSTKIHQDHEKLFEAMGWRPTDKIFTKVLV